MFISLPSPTGEKEEKGSGALPTRSSPPSLRLVDQGPPPSIWPTGVLTGRGRGAGRGGKSRSHQACESPPPASPSPERERVEDGRTLTRSSFPSSPRSDFGPFSASGHLTMQTPGSSSGRVGTQMLIGAMEVLNLAFRPPSLRWTMMMPFICSCRNKK